MIINLSEIPEEGKEFDLSDTKSSEYEEVRKSLEDLIGKNVFSTQFHIKSLNSRDFELKGKISTRTKELCSLCGIDINFPVKAQFHEILIPPQDHPRDGKYSKPNHFSELEIEGPESLEYGSQMKFNLGDYLHEIIALNTPFNPKPELTPKGDCSDCGLNPSKITEKINDQIPFDTEKTNPFSALKGLKVQ